MPSSQTVSSVCPQCGTQVAAALLSCPACHALVHADALKQLSQAAQQAAEAGDWATALSAWQRALELLPPEARQYLAVSNKVAAVREKLGGAAGAARTGTSPTGAAAAQGSAPPSGLALPRRQGATQPSDVESPSSQTARGAPAHAAPKSRWAGAAGAGALALLLWKFKFVLGFILTKGKLLILGLTKASTFFSMLLSLGVYWTAWGWKFALGVVLSIYVHEMGHVTALRRYGVKASAPMFIPGVGAVIRLKQNLTDARQDARVGLAGPVWGLAIAVVVYAVYLLTNWPSWAAIARVGAWINLFNLLPIWQLDGGRAFTALSRPHRWIVVLVIAAMWAATHEGLLVLLLLAAVVRALSGRPPAEPDRHTLLLYIFLVVALSRLCLLDVPVGDQP